MVKCPQATLGYYVDHQLVRMPARHANNTSNTQKAKQPTRAFRQLVKRAFTATGQSIRGICRDLRFSEEIEDLKNASKQGLLKEAYEITLRIALKCDGATSRGQRMIMAYICGIKNIENRSAIYYAAHSGHSAMCEVYLALLVIARAIKQLARAESIDKPLTIQNWLDHLGYLGFFDKNDFKVCVLNALNAKVKRVFVGKKFSLKDLKVIVAKSPWRYMLPYHVLYGGDSQTKSKRKAVKPKLNMGHKSDRLDDMGYDQDNLEGMEDTFKFEDCDDELAMQLYTIMIHDEAVGSSIEEAASVHVATKASSVSVCDSYSLVQDFDDEHWDTESEITTCDFVSDRNDGDDWSVISDSFSVQSINTEGTTPSYLDVLKFGKATAPPVIKPVLSRIVEDREEQIPCFQDATIADETDEFEYDDFRDGVKNSRGGKVKFRFKGNQQTSWHLPRKLRHYESNLVRHWKHKTFV